MLSHVVQHALALLVQTASLTVWLVILTVVFLPLERFFALRPTRLRARSLTIDLTYYFLNGLAPALILAIPASIIAAGVQKITPQAYTDAVAELPLWAKVALGIVVSELGAYWGHRFSHKNAFLWRFHKVHHSPESLDWMVNTRAHPVDVIFGTRLGGGTDINRALAYCQSRITRPAETVVVLISDLYEGGIRDEMLKRVAAMKASGVQFVTLLALSDEGAPAYDREHAAALAALGAPAFACTPDLFPEVMAAALEKRALPVPDGG